MSNELANHVRRTIGFKGMSGLHHRRSPNLRRWLPVALLALLSTGCSTNSEVHSTSIADPTTTTIPEQASETTASTVVQSNNVTPTSLGPDSSAVVPTTTAAISVSPTTTIVASTVVETTTTVKLSGTPNISVSPSSGLAKSGTRVVVRGTGFDVSKGIYVIVCNQAAWTDARRCVGGVNIDGASPVSEWVSSNPPGYAKGLTVPFAPDGSFTVTLLVRATDEATNLIDCSKEQCGVVTFADHTRRDDRSQDVFVPINFGSGS